VRPRIRPASFTASIDHDADREPDTFEQPDSDRPTLPSGSNEWVELNERFERKLRFGKIVLSLLPADDARARLLRAAIAERDEALLEGLLNSLDHASEPDTATEMNNPDSPASGDQRRTLLPPARGPKKR
jgi:hypothetical protein